MPQRHLEGYLAQGWRIDPAASEVEDLHSWHPEARAARQRLQARGIDVGDPAQS